MRESYDAAVGLIRCDWLTFSSYRTQLFSMIFGMLTSLTLFYFLSKLVSVASFPTHESYFSFVVIGMVILSVLQSTIRGELVAGTFERLILLISLTSGLYFPVALLPGYLQWISEVQPFTPAVDLLRNLLVSTPLSGTAAADVAKMVGFLIIMIPAGLLALKAGLRHAQRRGTIMEY
jgi:ABC-type multidrug transport system permease subunit